MVLADHPAAADGIDAPVRQEQPDACEPARVQQERALAEVGVHGLLGALEHAPVFHIVREGAIAQAGPAFRLPRQR